MDYIDWTRFTLSQATQLTHFERSVATIAVILAIATVAILTAFKYADIQNWFDTIPKIIIGTIITSLFVISSSAFILFLWGRGDDLTTILASQASTIIIIRIIMTVVTLIGAYGASALFTILIDKLATRNDAFDRHSKEVFIRFTQVTTFIIAILIVLGIWNINIGNLLIGAGFLGVVVGLSARQTLSASLAGFVLMLSQPFKIGDWVEIDEKRGRVVNITMVNTRIRSQNGEYIVIPNDSITENDITNLSAMGRLQLYVDVGVDYGTDIDNAVEIVEETTGDADFVMDAPGPTAYPDRFGDSSVVIRSYFWIENPSESRRRKAQAQVISNIKNRFDEEGITIPFPQRTLSNRDPSKPDRNDESTGCEGSNNQ